MHYKVLYHDNCMDGFTAAWAVNRWARSTNEKVEYVPVRYNQPFPDKLIDPQCNYIIVDFSYSKEILQQVASQCNTVLILDHHETAQNQLSNLVATDFNSWYTLSLLHSSHKNNLWAEFDMGRSGAQMAWDFFNDCKPYPTLIKYVADRDLFTRLLHGNEEITEFLKVQDKTFSNWDSLYEGFQKALDTLITNGSGLLTATKYYVNEIVKTHRFWHIDGYKVPVANCPLYLASDVGNALAKDNPLFAATYFDMPNGRVVSLRAQSKVAVNQIALKYGGGGHCKAAGFTVPLGWEGDT